MLQRVLSAFIALTFFLTSVVPPQSAQAQVTYLLRHPGGSVWVARLLVV